MSSNQDKVKSRPDRKLNKNQIQLLGLVYKFRFANTKLLANGLGLRNGEYVSRRVQVLFRSGYLGRNFNSSYRIKHKSASYYLLPKGVRALQAYSGGTITDAIIKGSYRDQEVSEQFIQHNLIVYAISNKLNKLYPEIKLYTKREMAIQDYFPKPLPDSYLSLKRDGEVRRFLLEFVETYVPSFVIDRRLRNLIEYCRDQTWQSRGGDFPPILFVCDTGSLERRLHKQIDRVLFRVEADMLFYTTAQAALLNSAPGTNKIWSSSKEPDKLYSLTSLSVTP